MNRKSQLFVLLTLALCAFVSACSSSSHHAQQVILVMDAPPPGALEIKIPVPIDATVTNDSGSGGVVWTLACDTGADCGSLSSGTSASGTPVVYTAPATIPEGDVSTGMTVLVTATSGTDSTVFATSPVIIFSISDTSLVSGPFAFVVSGSNTLDDVYSAAGSVTLDGAGNVVGGEEDYNDADIITSTAVTITGGTYTVGQDGQGTMSLTLSDPTIGDAGVQTMAFTWVNLNHARIIQFDDTATSSGSMDFQTFTAGDETQIAGGYAFAYNGFFDTAGPYAAGGVLTADGAGNLLITLDENIGGSIDIGESGPSNYSAPDVNGRGTFNVGSRNFAYYIVHAECLRAVEIDANITTAGSLYGQGGNPFDVTSLNGPNVFLESGSGTFALDAIAGTATADGAGNISAGFGDANEGNGTPTNGAITGTYSFDPSGDGYGSASLVFTNTPDVTLLGVYATDPALNLSDPNNTSGGGGALIVDLDPGVTAAGFLTAQDTSASIFGNYAVDYLAQDLSDLAGQVLSDGVSNLTGSGSLNDLFFTGENSQAITATFAADGTNAGRSTVTASFGTAYTDLSIVAYQATNGEIVFVEVDPSLIASGVLEGQ